jgi:uncharacterized membrane protein
MNTLVVIEYDDQYKAEEVRLTGSSVRLSPTKTKASPGRP